MAVSSGCRSLVIVQSRHRGVVTRIRSRARLGRNHQIATTTDLQKKARRRRKRSAVGGVSVAVVHRKSKGLLHRLDHVTVVGMASLLIEIAFPADTRAIIKALRKIRVRTIRLVAENQVTSRGDRQLDRQVLQSRRVLGRRSLDSLSVYLKASSFSVEVRTWPM